MGSGMESSDAIFMWDDPHEIPPFLHPRLGLDRLLTLLYYKNY